MVSTIPIDWSNDVENNTFSPPLNGGPLAQDVVFWTWSKKQEQERKKKAELKKEVYVTKVLPALRAVLQIRN